MYEILVLGATYAAAGIGHRYGEKCLILEQRQQAGYEFFGRENDRELYVYLKECHTLFGVGILRVKQTERGFLCETYGVDGFRSYEAKRVVDTRCNEGMSGSKTYDLLIDCKGERKIIQCPVSLSCGYAEAREHVRKMLRELPQGQRLIRLADEFNYTVKEEYPKTEGGILYLPSKGYQTPEEAFSAGEEVGE